MPTFYTRCPECEGLGYINVLVSMSYDGGQNRRNERCTTCHGDGVIEMPPDEDEGEDE